MAAATTAVRRAKPTDPIGSPISSGNASARQQIETLLEIVRRRPQDAAGGPRYFYHTDPDIDKIRCGHCDRQFGRSLRYFFSGDTAVMVIGQAERILSFDLGRLPVIKQLGSYKVPSDISQKFAGLAKELPSIECTALSGYRLPHSMTVNGKRVRIEVREWEGHGIVESRKTMAYPEYLLSHSRLYSPIEVKIGRDYLFVEHPVDVFGRKFESLVEGLRKVVPLFPGVKNEPTIGASGVAGLLEALQDKPLSAARRVIAAGAYRESDHEILTHAFSSSDSMVSFVDLLRFESRAWARILREGR